MRQYIILVIALFIVSCSEKRSHDFYAKQYQATIESASPSLKSELLRAVSIPAQKMTLQEFVSYVNKEFGTNIQAIDENSNLGTVYIEAYFYEAPLGDILKSIATDYRLNTNSSGVIFTLYTTPETIRVNQ